MHPCLYFCQNFFSLDQGSNCLLTFRLDSHNMEEVINLEKIRLRIKGLDLPNRFQYFFVFCSPIIAPLEAWLAPQGFQPFISFIVPRYILLRVEIH